MALLRQVRRGSRAVAALLVCAWVAGLPHFTQDDAACAPAPVDAIGEHQETQHSVASAGPDHQDHCALCHWFRSLRSPRANSAAASVAFTPPTFVETAAHRPYAAPPLHGLPARAPPATR